MPLGFSAGSGYIDKVTPASPCLSFGPFEIYEPVGRGANATVYRGLHREQDIPVAVKVIKPRIQKGQLAADPLGREVRAVAGLDHPGIVRVHDYGHLPSELPATAEGLDAEAPFLVMDLHDGGTLWPRLGESGWAELRSILLTLLDALAHAHARGVIHRDLKPQNVLLGSQGPVLTDFGVAFALNREFTSRTAGSPNYMAPEQVQSDWRAFGPWTDLYAVGCLGWALTTGQAPFHDSNPITVMKAQLRSTLPAFRPRAPMPTGLEDWLRRLLAKHPQDRYAFAADAALALMAMPEPSATAPLPRIGPAAIGLADQTLVAPPVFVHITEQSWAEGTIDETRPPVPTNWRRPEGLLPPTRLLGTGRGLADLREPALRGREAVRDGLWDALKDVCEDGGVRVSLLRGPSGYGKTRLAWWLCYRAHELGLAQPLMCNYEETRGPGCGVGPMLERLFACFELEGEKRTDRIRQRLPGMVSADHLAEFGALMALDNSYAVDGTRVTFTNEEEKFTALLHLVERLGERRPVLLFFDDLQWGDEAMRFVEYTLARRPRLPLHIVGTIRDDVPHSPASVSLQGRVLSYDNAHQMSIGPLDDDAQAALITAWLPLEPGALNALIRRSAGSPLFAAELVRHWARTGALVVTNDGFRVRDDADETLPDGLRSLWSDRLNEVMARHSQEVRFAFEVAAALGQTVDPREWRAVLTILGIEPPDAVLEAMIYDRLCQELEDGRWMFVHAMLREVLAQGARESERWAGWNAACAQHLANTSHHDHERRANHYLAAGDAESAIPLLLSAVLTYLRDRRDHIGGQRALFECIRALRSQRVSRDSPQWLEARILWTYYRHMRPEGYDLIRHVERNMAAATRSGEPHLETLALLVQGTVLLLNDTARAETILRHTSALAVTTWSPGAAAMPITRFTQALLILGRGNEARPLLAHALKALGGSEDDHARLSLRIAESKVEVTAGNLDDARTALMAARDLAVRLGIRNRLGQVHNILGDVSRYSGDLYQAERHYREAHEVWSSLGIKDADVAALNQGLVQFELERFEASHETLLRVLRSSEDAGRLVLVKYTRATLLPSLAGLHAWEHWDAQWAEIGDLISGKLVDLDIGRAAHVAARLAYDAAEFERGDKAWRLSVTQYRSAGRPEIAEAIQDEWDARHAARI